MGQVETIKCPRCGNNAKLVDAFYVVFGCDNPACATPVYGLGRLSERFDEDPESPGCGVSYKPFEFLLSGEEVF